MQTRKQITLTDIEHLINSEEMSIGALNRAGLNPAYVITNEDMRLETEITRDNAQRVLTVAASGDQALFYLLAGAKHIDTYDMTLAAKIIQEIKFAAIRQQVPYNDYISMLIKLHNGTPDMMGIPYMSDIVQDTSPTTAHFIRTVKNPIHFSYGSAPCDNNKQNWLTPDEYAQLQSMRPQTPSFIWSNIADLHHHIRGKYDVINTSNIFDYVPELLTPVLTKMQPHMTENGAIITECHKQPAYEAIFDAQEKFKNQLKFGSAKKRDCLICIQKIR